MSKRDIQDAEIREYILGQGSPDSTERLDEHSFSDEYSDRIDIVEREIIDEFLTGQLNADEKLAFENNYLSSPTRRHKVNFAKELFAYARDQGTVASRDTSEISIFNVFRRRRLTFQFAAAGLIVFLGSVGWLLFRNSTSTEVTQVRPDEVISSESTSPRIEPTPTSVVESPDVSPEPTPDNSGVTDPTRAVVTPTRRPQRPVVRQPSVATLLLTPALRSSTFQQLKMPAGTTTAELRLWLETELDGPFQAEVLDLPGRSRIWSARDLVPRKTRYGSILTLRIPATVLGNGEYQISISQIGPAGEPETIGDYFFRITS